MIRPSVALCITLQFSAVQCIAPTNVAVDEAREVEGRPGILYRYMDTVPIPILSLMDDCFVISESGFKAELINTFMNTQSASKRFQFNHKKCKTFNTGDFKDQVLPNSLKVDNWKIEYDQDENLVETEVKNPAYRRHRICRPMRIVGPIQFWRGCMIYQKKIPLTGDTNSLDRCG